MDIRKLQNVVILAETLSFTKAAERLNITQSALSQSIKALEDEHRVRLFDRNRGSVHLTSLGRRFVTKAKTLLRERDELETMLRLESKGETVDISIGMSPLPARVLLPPLLIEMIGTLNLHIEVAVSGPVELLAMLTDEKIEFCICANRQIPPNAPVTGILLGSYRFGPLVREGHPLSQRTDVTLDDLRQYPTMLSSKRPMDTAYAGEPMEIIPDRPSIVVENYEVLREVTLNSDAVWITSPLAVTRELAAGQLRELRLDKSFKLQPVEMVAYHLRNRYPSLTASRIVKRLKAILLTSGLLNQERAG